MKQRVLLLSTVHPGNDPRILYKIAPALLEHYEVFCALPHANSNHGFDGIISITLPFYQKLFARLLFCHTFMLWKCLRLRPNLVHIFVPELIPAAFLFQWLGAKVIYEVQENLYKKFSIKQFNNNFVYRKFFRYFDLIARKKFHLIFTEKAYLQDYKDLTLPHAIVQNFVSLPLIDAIPANKLSISAKYEFFYAGVISLERCFDVIIQAFAELKLTYPDFHVHLFGPVRLGKQKLESLPGYDQIAGNLTFYGYQDQKVALGYASKCLAGIALLKPLADYPESYTTKMFEYMALRLPVITSDFPLYKKVVEYSECGFCISPYNAATLCEKMTWLIENPAGRLDMGINGRKSVEESYNWALEKQTLLSFYRTLA